MITSILFYLILLPALLPVVIILIYVYSKEKKDREPLGLLVKIFVLGAVFALPCIPIEGVMASLFNSLLDAKTIQYALVENIFGVALVEETFKFLVIMLFIWKNKNFDYRYDGIVYAVTSSLGFAAIENIIYVIRFGTGVSIGRAIFAIPGHASFGVFMGFFLSRAKDFSLRGENGKAGFNIVLSLLIPMLVHGLYDFILSDQVKAFSWSTYAFLAWVIVLDVVAFFAIRHDFKTDKPLGQSHLADDDGNYLYP